jgi:hypothetical protein
VEDPREVQRDIALPLRDVEVSEPPQRAAARVVEQDRRRAQVRGHGVDDGCERAEVGHVHRIGTAPDLGGDLPCSRRVEVQHRHRRALRGKAAAGRPADAGAATGDDRHLTAEHRIAPGHTNSHALTPTSVDARCGQTKDSERSSAARSPCE